MNSPTDSTIVADTRHVSYTHLMYGLHAAAVVIGLLTAASIIGSFLFTLPSIIAVIMNYVRRGDVRGTWLESHFSWQLRTFWWGLAWAVVIAAISLPLMLVVIGFGLWIAGYCIVGLWVAYRIIRGWLTLRDGRPMPG